MSDVILPVTRSVHRFEWFGRAQIGDDPSVEPNVPVDDQSLVAAPDAEPIPRPDHALFTRALLFLPMV